MLMNTDYIIKELAKNRAVFEFQLADTNEQEYLWKPTSESWCLLEIVCHLYDEERDDFRTRTKHVLETPALKMSPIDPPAWVVEHDYIKQDFNQKVTEFLEERSKSIEWLNSLQNSQWNNVYLHPQLGEMSAFTFLSNWLVHDFIHIRQIMKVKFDYLQHHSDESLNYAGNW